MKWKLLWFMALMLAILPCALGEEASDPTLMPRTLRETIDQSVFGQDELLAYYLCEETYDPCALAAFDHQGKSVLVGYQFNGGWHPYVISDTLLPEGDFSFAYHYHGDKDTLAIVQDGQSICLMPTFFDFYNWFPYLAHRDTADGGMQQVHLYSLPDQLTYAFYDVKGNGVGIEHEVETGDFALHLPGDPALMTFDMIPYTKEEAEAWQAPIALPEEGSWAVCDGCNFRALPDVRSTSKGYYNPGTVVELMGVRVFNWQMVRVGNETGWMHVNYVNGPEYFLSAVLPVAVTEEETELLAYDGTVLRTLPKGTAMHILGSSGTVGNAENGTFYHVCLPQGELGLTMDVTGEYGYVKEDGLTIYANTLNWNYNTTTAPQYDNG